MNDNVRNMCNVNNIIIKNMFFKTNDYSIVKHIFNNNYLKICKTNDSFHYFQLITCITIFFL